jgi:hypothetical protein
VKGLNVKKIAALAIGALFVGSAAVSASKLMYEDTTLVSDNGVPQVSVLIPGASTAAMTDGVAGARIASKLAAESYKEVTYSAELTGTAVCGADEGAEGSCPVTDKSVSMTITSPGIQGAYTFEASIYDVLDLDLNNRAGDETTPEDELGGDDNEDDVSPFFENTGDTFLGLKIDSGFTPFVDYDVTAGSFEVTEKQYTYLEGITNYEVDSVPFGDFSQIVYSVKFFWLEDQGIPVCTEADHNDWGYCLISGEETKEMGSKRPTIKLFNDYWHIINMDPPGTDVTNDDDRVSGGSITLAKEAAYGIISVGEQLTTEDYYVQLDDISVGTGAGFAHPAIVSLIDKSTGEVVEQTQINPGNTEDMGPSDEIAVHIYQTAPGITLTSKWAELAVYSEEWELDDGDEIEDNEDWFISLYWKNRDGAAADATTDGSEEDPDNLREIVFYNDDSFELSEGETYNIMDDPVAFDLTYDGLSTEDMTKLTFEFAKDDPDECTCDAAGDSDCEVNEAKAEVWLKISTASDEFEGEGANDGNIIYVALEEQTDADAFGADVAGHTWESGDVWVYDPNDKCVEEDGEYADTEDWEATYDTAGDNGVVELTFNDGGLVAHWGTAAVDTADGDYIDIIFTQEVGEVDSAEDTSTTAFTVYRDGDDWEIRNTNADDDQQAVYTVNGFAANCQLDDFAETVEDDFVDIRGTEYSLTSTKYEFNVPKSVRDMLFTFTTHGDEATPNTATWTANEGDSQTFADTTITVDTITCTTGACTVSGAGAAGCAYTGGLEAIISGEGAASVAGMAPGTVNPSSLIMLDTEGASLSGNFVSVAGPVVNTVTARELTGANAHDFNAQAVLVKQIAPGKIVVAGRDAADTLTAANQFIAAMQRV